MHSRGGISPHESKRGIRAHAADCCRHHDHTDGIGGKHAHACHHRCSRPRVHIHVGLQAVLASTWLWSPSQSAGTRPLSMRGDRTADWLRLLGGRCVGVRVRGLGLGGLLHAFVLIFPPSPFRVAGDGDWARAGSLLSMHLAPNRTHILPTPQVQCDIRRQGVLASNACVQDTSRDAHRRSRH